MRVGKEAESPSVYIICHEEKDFLGYLANAPFGKHTVLALRNLISRTSMHPCKNIWLIAYYASNTVLGSQKSPGFGGRGSSDLKKEEMSLRTKFSQC